MKKISTAFYRVRGDFARLKIIFANLPGEFREV